MLSKRKISTIKNNLENYLKELKVITTSNTEPTEIILELVAIINHLKNIIDDFEIKHQPRQQAIKKVKIEYGKFII